MIKIRYKTVLEVEVLADDGNVVAFPGDIDVVECGGIWEAEKGETEPGRELVVTFGLCIGRAIHRLEESLPAGTIPLLINTLNADYGSRLEMKCEEQKKCEDIKDNKVE